MNSALHACLIVNAGAAIANAIFAATVWHVTEVPVTRERVLAALKA